MDVWEFVVRSEWPIVVGGTIWLLRQSFQDMLNRISPTKVDAFGFKAEFERTLEKVEQLTAPTDEQKSPAMAFDSKPPDSSELIAVSPEAVVLESWRQLEKAVRQKIPDAKKGNITFLPLSLSTFKDQLKFSEDEIAAYKSLHRLRNEVAHSEITVTRAGALKFKEAADRLRNRLATNQ